MTKSYKLLISIFLSVALGLALAYVVGIESKQYLGHSILLLCALWAYILNGLIFVPASIAQSEKFYDLTGSVTYISTTVLAVYLSGPIDLRAIVVAILVIIWAMRLGGFLFLRIKRDKKDRRFDKIKINPIRFLLAWTLQGCWVVFTAICALSIITSASPKAWDIFASIGLAIWVIGFVIEVIADRQKKAFKADPENKGRFITTGLWARSQHPNYFGEITLWSGMSIMALPILSDWQYLALISPIFVFWLLTQVSGIPMLQKTAQERWGSEQAFKDYQAKTPLLFPTLF